MSPATLNNRDEKSVKDLPAVVGKSGGTVTSMATPKPTIPSDK